MNIKSSLNWALPQLIEISDSAKLDAEVLLAFILKKDRSYLYTWPANNISIDQQQDYQEIIKHRKAGTPIAYLIGNKEFWSLNLSVTNDTLIPRPETELLVEQCLLLIATANCKIIDLGTGCGAIALALASENNNLQITASDQSLSALKIAQHNAERLMLQNICFIHSNWYQAIGDNKFDIIISNPPYISEFDPLLSQGDVRFEPHSALISGADGLNDIRSLIKDSVNFLMQDGWLLLEHGFEQQAQVQEVFKNYHYKNITSKNDLAGRPRITFAQYE